MPILIPPIQGHRDIADVERTMYGIREELMRLSSDKSELGWYNVKDYGAVGDGVADDTAAIQAAITAADDTNGAAVVYFPNTGAAYLTTEIILTTASMPKVILMGDGGYKCSEIQITGTTNNAGIYANYTDSSWFGIVNLSIKAATALTNLVYINAASNFCSLRNVHLHGNSQTTNGLYLNGGTAFTGQNIYSTGFTGYNYYLKNFTSMFYLNGSNADVATNGWMYVDSTTSGGQITLFAPRIEMATAKKIIQTAAATQATNITIMGGMLWGAGRPAAIVSKVSGGAVEYNLDLQFQLTPSKWYEDQGDATNDVYGLVGASQVFSGSPVRLTSKQVFTNSVICAADTAMRVRGDADADNQQFMDIKTKTTLLSDLSSSATWTNAIPSGSLVLGVSARVTTLITANGGGATWDLGYTGDGDAFGTGLAFAANTTVDIANYVITSPVYITSTTNIILAPDAGAFTAGAVRLTLYYVELTPPTS